MEVLMAVGLFSGDMAPLLDFVTLDPADDNAEDTVVPTELSWYGAIGEPNEEETPTHRL